MLTQPHRYWRTILSEIIRKARDLHEEAARLKHAKADIIRCTGTDISGDCTVRDTRQNNTSIQKKLDIQLRQVQILYIRHYNYRDSVFIYFFVLYVCVCVCNNNKSQTNCWVYFS